MNYVKEIHYKITESEVTEEEAVAHVNQLLDKQYKNALTVNQDVLKTN